MAEEDYLDYRCDLPDPPDPTDYPRGYWNENLITDLETSHLENILYSFSKKVEVADTKLTEIETELRFRALEERIKLLESKFNMEVRYD